MSIKLMIEGVGISVRVTKKNWENIILNEKEILKTLNKHGGMITNNREMILKNLWRNLKLKK